MAFVFATSGTVGADTSTYDFSGVTSPSTLHLAEDGEVDQSDAVIQNGTFPSRRDWGADWALWGEASSGEYSNLVSSDDLRYVGADPGLGDDAAMLFTFYVSENPSEVDMIQVSVEVGRASSNSVGWVYIWNYVASDYEILGSQSGTADRWFQRSSVPARPTTSRPEPARSPSSS